MMDVLTTDIPDIPDAPDDESSGAEEERLPGGFCHLRFRSYSGVILGWFGQERPDRGDIVMVQTDHGLEPATVLLIALYLGGGGATRREDALTIVRKAGAAEIAKAVKLEEMEQSAAVSARACIARRGLPMRLVRVERFFDGSKVIFYFTAENRVDFRELVRDLVQEFRTRVEMRQVGVRHEAKMVGGIGSCGRVLCCVTHINQFDAVSIRMAKDQDLPLNPAKISGVCNRLLCCLAYEADTYRALRKDMPKVGKKVVYNGMTYKVRSVNVLRGVIVLVDEEGGETTLVREQWLESGRALEQENK